MEDRELPDKTPSGQPLVELVDYMGSDLTVVNAARVSFKKRKDKLDEKDERLIKYLARNAHWCYDKDTEILTDSGWKLFEDLTERDLIAQVVNWETDPEIEFVKPLKIHKTHYVGPMYLCESYMVNFCVTPNHKMLIKRRHSHGWRDWEIETSDKSFGINKKVLLAAKLKRKDGTGTYWEGFYKGFILGDGCRVSKNYISVRLKRERKINIFDKCLKELKKPHRKVFTKDGVTQFVVYEPSNRLPKAANKKLPPLKDKSSSFIRGLFDGLVASDGSRKRKGYVFSSTSIDLVEGFSFLATLMGYNVSNITVFRQGTDRHRRGYRVTALSRTTANLNMRSKRKGKNVKRMDETIKLYDGPVYCVTVPSGMVMVRRKGRQLVCGNTPFSHVVVTFIFRMPICIARQWYRHTVGLTRNEMSRRYVDDPPEFMPPFGLRKRAPNVKQGSSDECLSNPPIISTVLSNRVEIDAEDLVRISKAYYEALIDAGVAPEVARFYLPQGTLTHMRKLFPLSWSALMDSDS